MGSSLSVRCGLVTTLALLAGVTAESMRARFAGFSYFAGDAAFCVDASFERAAEDEKQFQDRTNGKETYGGGRYLDLYFPIGVHTELDFNHAYNPLCAYDSKFTCPMPPPENRLKIAVTAGEKAYASKQ